MTIRSLLPMHVFRRSVGSAAWLRVFLATAVLTVSAGVSSAAEAEWGNSLDWVPADASAYSASFRIKEQIDMVAASTAWQKLKEIPSVAMLWQMAEMQINNEQGPAAIFWQMMELPENKQLVKVLGEMFSDEIVFYAGDDFPKFIELIQTVQGNPVDQILDGIEASARGDNSPQAGRMEAAIEAIKADPELLEIPQMVLAFHVEDAEAADTQLARLEVLANMALQQTDAIEAKFERETIGDAEFIVLKLDGSMIPWGADAPHGFPGGESSYQDIKAIASDKTAVIALGAWNNYLIISFGRSTEHLAELGEGDGIGAREEFAALEDYADEKLVSVAYVSQAMAKAGQFQGEDLDGMAERIEQSLADVDDIPAEMKDRLGDDLPELADDIKPYLPKPGAKASFQFLTDGGYEGYSYNWSEIPRLDSSQPLEMMAHLGGSPLFALVARGTHNPEDYDVLAKWVEKGIGYFEDFALDEMDEDDREEATEALAVIKPLLTRFDQTTREHLIPAMEDGQSAIVLDADIKSAQWHEEMPESSAELPMAELAIVVGVSDAEEFKVAMSEYRDIINDAIDAVREKSPDDVPEDFEFPAPEVKEVEDGEVFTWALPEEAGLDEQIAPCGGLNDHIAVFATSPDLAERVLAEQLPEAIETMGGADQPRAVAVGIHFAELIDAAAPWIDFGIRSNFVGEDGLSQDPEDDPEQVQDIRSQVDSGLEILKCFRGAWAETRLKDGVWVTHSKSFFEDVEE